MDALKQAVIFLLEKHLEQLYSKQATRSSALEMFKDDKGLLELERAELRRLRQEIGEVEGLLAKLRDEEK